MAEAKLIDGKAFAAGLRQRVGKDVTDLIANGGSAPGLATVMVGADPASQVYVRSKGKLATELGFAASHVRALQIVNSGHWIMEEQPAAAVTAITAFLAEGR